MVAVLFPTKAEAGNMFIRFLESSSDRRRIFR